MRVRSLALITTILVAGALPACTCSSSGDGDGGGGSGGEMGIPLPNGQICYIAPCQGHVYACGDCMDNDGDGLYDWQDPDCLGPCQNNEAGFYGAIPGQNNAPCKMDCYWDQDTGAGNDNCYWDHGCDTFEQGPMPCTAATCPEIGCNYDPNTQVSGAPVPSGANDCEYLLANQSAQCNSYCGVLAPNGCDCFGCCENPNKPGSFVYAGSVDSSGRGTCDPNPATLEDPTKCKPCTPVNYTSGGSCYNACAHCELCFGKTELPADCYGDMGAVPYCPTGVQPCTATMPCPANFYCTTGCCIGIVP
jgi:hypothetical protein